MHPIWRHTSKLTIGGRLRGAWHRWASVKKSEVTVRGGVKGVDDSILILIACLINVIGFDFL